MTVLRNLQQHFIETPGANAGAAIATPSRGACDVSVIRQRQQPGGTNHVHTHDREEVMVMLQGQVALGINDESTVLAAGDSAIIPASTPHHVATHGSEPAEWLLIAPAGVRFFHADGAEATPPWSK